MQPCKTPNCAGKCPSHHFTFLLDLPIWFHSSVLPDMIEIHPEEARLLFYLHPQNFLAEFDNIYLHNYIKITEELNLINKPRSPTDRYCDLRKIEPRVNDKKKFYELFKLKTEKVEQERLYDEASSNSWRNDSRTYNSDSKSNTFNRPYNVERSPYNKSGYSRPPYNRTSNDRPPYNPDRQPYNPDRQPYNPDRQPFNRERQPYNPDRQPFNRERPPFNRERPPYNPERPPYNPDRQPYNRDRQPYNPERQQYSYSDRQLYNKDGGSNYNDRQSNYNDRSTNPRFNSNRPNNYNRQYNRQYSDSYSRPNRIENTPSKEMIDLTDKVEEEKLFEEFVSDDK